MNLRTPFAALIILMAASAPTLAQQLDGGELTCAEFVGMNAADKNAGMGAVRGFARESVNATAAGTVAQTDQLTDDEFMGRMDAACIDAAPGKTIIDAMRGA
jgi:hypothetical protein